LKGRVLELNITETWGDLFYVGLTGLEVLDGNNRPIPISLNMVKADPRDMNQIAGHNSDYRTLDKLFNGVNNTVDDHNMWLIPFNKGEKHSITIDFGKVQAVSAIRFYNYNKSEEDTLRGVK
jgi:protein JBTS26